MIGLNGFPDCRLTIGETLHPCARRDINAPCALERHQVDRAQHEAMPGVEIGQRALAREVAEILRLRIRTADRVVVDRFREGIRRVERQVAA